MSLVSTSQGIMLDDRDYKVLGGWAIKLAGQCGIQQTSWVNSKLFTAPCVNSHTMQLFNYVVKVPQAFDESC